MKAHDLRDALRARQVRISFDLASAEQEAELEHGALAEVIDRAHKFEARYESVIDNEDLHQTAIELWRAGILRPPYPETYVEIEFPKEAGYRPAIICRHNAAINETVLRFFAYWPKDRIWTDTGLAFRSNYAASPPEGIVYVADSSAYRDNSWSFNRDMVAHGQANFMTLCCFMSTKHSRLSPVEAPEKLNRQREKRGVSPVYSHYRIDLSPEIAERATGDGTHASPRLHWRRGHVRTLPTGSKVGVKPHLVGLAERGFVSKDYRVLPPRVK